MAKPLVKTLIYIVLVLFLFGLFRTIKERNMIQELVAEEFDYQISEDELRLIRADANALANSTYMNGDFKCPEFKDENMLSENLRDQATFDKDFKNNEANRRYLRSMMRSLVTAIDNRADEITLVKTIKIRYRGVEVKIPFAFE